MKTILKIRNGKLDFEYENNCWFFYLQKFGENVFGTGRKITILREAKLGGLRRVNGEITKIFRVRRFGSHKFSVKILILYHSFFSLSKNWFVFCLAFDSFF